MRSVVMAALRWPLHSIPRFVCVVVALVAVGFGLNALEGTEEEGAPALASESAAPSDGGGEVLPAQRNPQQLATTTVKAYVLREAPDSTTWSAEVAPYVSPDVLAALTATPWAPAENAPVTPTAVSIEGGYTTLDPAATTWAGTVIARTSTASGDEVHRFAVEATREGEAGPWILTKLEEVQA